MDEQWEDLQKTCPACGERNIGDLAQHIAWYHLRTSGYSYVCWCGKNEWETLRSPYQTFDRVVAHLREKGVWAHFLEYVSGARHGS
jgi:hypothetical protein